MTIQAPHGPSPEHLSAIVAEMAVLGVPSIQAYWSGEMWLAVEGSHRLAACEVLGICPDIIPVEGDSEIDHDFEDVSGNTVGDVLDYLEQSGPILEFEDL